MIEERVEEIEQQLEMVSEVLEKLVSQMRTISEIVDRLSKSWSAKNYRR